MDENAFKEILQENRDRVFSYSVYCLHDRDEAEDITQDAFLRLWRNRGDVDPERVEAWLVRVAHNLCIDRIRRRRTARVHLDGPEMKRAVEDAVKAAQLHGPDRDLQREQTRALLLEAMDGLRDETRSAVIMHYFQDMRIEDIARVLEQKTGTIKVRLHRARKALRTILDPIAGCGPAAERERA